MGSLNRDTYLEWTTVGAFTRLAVVDVTTGFEVVVFGPADGDPRAIERVGHAKLSRALERAGVLPVVRPQHASEAPAPHRPASPDRKAPLPRQRGFSV